MKQTIEESNLKLHILDQISDKVGRKLEKNVYYDVCPANELTTNNRGIDIIAHQLELVFENSKPIFISWATISNWMQFSLCISEKSFCGDVERFTKIDQYWDSVIGCCLIDFDVYGYKEHTITTTLALPLKTKKETYLNEPHLLILEFDNKRVLGVANFYLENNFIPKQPMGDDLWIAFEKSDFDMFINCLGLEKLN